MQKQVLLCLTTFLLLIIRSNGILTYMFANGDTTCQGTGTFVEKNRTWEVVYDVHGLYKAGGWTKKDTWLNNITHEYHFTLCGNLDITECSGEWCFEQINSTINTSCVAGIAEWTVSDQSDIRYYGSFDISENATKVNSVALTIVVTHVVPNNSALKCPHNVATVNYNVICAIDQSTFVTSVWENYTICVWNASYRSSYGCLTAAIPTSSSDSDDLSAGSIILIVAVLVALAYLILGCAYNSFYHGRVGMDALPNKDSWICCCRSVKAGCEATRDTLFCCRPGTTTGEFQHL